MIARLIQRIRETGAPVCVGLDPMLSYIPNQILERAFDEKGENLEGAAEAVWQFNRGIIDATYDLIPAVKPQIAMYEQFGIPGLSVYEKTVRYCQEKALVVIGDAKRGDIGSTSEAYAAAHIGAVQIGAHTCEAFGTDMVTVNPYLGSDGIRPFLAACNQFDKGIFVLVKTSNPSGSEFQDRRRFMHTWQIRWFAGARRAWTETGPMWERLSGRPIRRCCPSSESACRTASFSFRGTAHRGGLRRIFALPLIQKASVQWSIPPEASLLHGKRTGMRRSAPWGSRRQRGRL